ncbi:hypothetical protein V1956_14495 [Yersinia sp. 2540 StPb PI]|uniref:hypothetical protein n=1 Tax=Yersinia sp. 2540 StPb PI TaxID=3117406 RepID=UPI003FA42460
MTKKRVALVTGASSGIGEASNGQILFAVFIELFLGIAFVLSNRSAKKNFTDKRDRVNDK